MSRLQLMLSALSLFGCTAYSGRSQGSEAGRRTEVYKTIGSSQLSLDIYEDPKSKNQTSRPAIVFFFGGGWSTGSRNQFEPQARYFASRGMVAITPEYRVRTRHQSKVVDSVADARSAIRWVRSNAKRLGIDPNLIAAGGGSAGGHLAACTAFIDAFDDASEDPKISAVPNALVLFNPALVLAQLPGSQFNLRAVPDPSFLGTEPSRISPAHHIKPGGPPTVIFHGEADATVPFDTAKAFSERMKAAGNACQLTGYPGQGHGFFNQEPWMTKTLASADEFLTSLGWLKGKGSLSTPK